MYMSDAEYEALSPEDRASFDEECGREAEAEIAAENAWLRAAEYDPEAEAFEQYEARMGLLPPEDFAMGLGEIDGGGF